MATSLGQGDNQCCWVGLLCLFVLIFSAMVRSKQKRRYCDVGKKVWILHSLNSHPKLPYQPWSVLWEWLWFNSAEQFLWLLKENSFYWREAIIFHSLDRFLLPLMKNDIWLWGCGRRHIIGAVCVCVCVCVDELTAWSDAWQRWHACFH